MKKHILTLLLFIFGSNVVAMDNQSTLSIDQELVKKARTNLGTLIKSASVDELNKVANLMLLQAQTYDAFKKIYPLIPLLAQYQKYRVRDYKKGSFIRTFGIARSSQDAGVKFDTNTKNGTQYGFYSNNPETIALMLQIAPMMHEQYTKENIDYLNSLFKKHPNNKEIDKLAGIAIHLLYSLEFKNNYFYGISGFVKPFFQLVQSHQEILNYIIQNQSCSNDAKNFVANLFFAKEIFALVGDLSSCYLTKGDENEDSIIINNDFISIGKKIEFYCQKFELYKKEYQKLYTILMRMLSLKVNQAKISKDVYMIKKANLFATGLTVEEVYKCLEQKSFLPEFLWPEIESNLRQQKEQIEADQQKNIKKRRRKRGKNQSQQNKQNSQIDNDQSTKKEEKPEVVYTQQPTFSIPKIKQDNQLQPTWIEVAKKSHIEPIKLDKSTHSDMVTKYDQRVLRWFDKNSTDQDVVNADDNSRLYHSFPLCVDNYIFSLGIQTDWQNQTNSNQIDKNYSLGGEIIFANGESKQVVFTCCKDPNEVCYHRGYTIKEQNSLFDEYFAKSCWEVSFPPLGLSNNTITNAPVAYTYQDKDDFGSYIISENEFCVRIKDNKNNVDIILYKPHKTIKKEVIS